jgi:hypothetical protein
VTARQRAVTATGGVLLAIATVGCSGGGSGTVPASQVSNYVNAVEAVRLPVNTLLNGADPILEAYQKKQITPVEASMQMSALESRFAGYLLKVHQIEPSNSQLKAINVPYADTYYYEDAYLATMASDLRSGSFANLPNTQGAQRLAIIIWRTKLELIAAKSGVTLPADLQQAGRGEIAPGPPGSS